MRGTGRHLLAVDACVAAVVTAAYVALAGGDAGDGAPSFSGPWWAGWLLALCVGAPLAVRRLWPLPVLGVVLSASAAATLLHITRDPYLAVALAAYAVALAEPVRRASAALAVALVVSAATVTAGEGVGIAAFVWLVIGGAWGAGRAVRERRLRAGRRERRLAEEALAEERLRIARELHDIVSHSLSVIVVKASVANHVAETRPEETRAAVQAIEQTGREALTEMRRALGVLRGTAETAPPPGLDDLPALVRLAERAGVRAELRTRVEAQLPAGAALTVYRIVQEALTNVVKHAGEGARCRVAVTVSSGGSAHVEVADDGAGRAASELRGGHGLVGMRERVMTYGGTLTLGPRPDGGFAVSAHLPPGDEGTA